MLEILQNICVIKIFNIPIIVIANLFGAIFLMFRLKFINILDFFKSVKFVQTSLVKSEAKKPMNLFLTQFGGNLGIGTIAGGIFALKFGGASVIFWFLAIGFVLSLIKFSEITIGHKYRSKSKEVNFGGMFYVVENSNIKLPKLIKKTISKIIAISTTILIIIAVSFQFSQMNSIILPNLNSGNFNVKDFIILSVIVLFICYILFGKIDKIINFSKIAVPIMIVVYIALMFIIIFQLRKLIPNATQLIFNSILDFKAGLSALIATIVVVIQRLCFAAEIGLGTSSMIHSNSAVKYPAQQGYFAIIDSFVISSFLAMTSFVALLMTIYASYDLSSGIFIFSGYIDEHISKYIFEIVVVLFALTTVTSNSYCFKTCIGYVTKRFLNKTYSCLYLLSILVATIFFSSLELLAIADFICLVLIVVNILIITLLSKEVKEELINFKLDFTKKIK